MNEGAIYRPRSRNWHPVCHTPKYKSSILRTPKKPLICFSSTSSEVTGPVFGHELIGQLDNDLVRNFGNTDETAIGPRIIVHGRVIDEGGNPVPNALIEIWQANAAGRYRHKNDNYIAPLDPNFGGCGRTLTAADGSYEFFTIQPGAYPWPNHENAWRPGHIHFSVFGSSFAQRLITQMYFEGDPLIPLCPIVNTIPDKRAIEQLVARLDMQRAVSMDRLAYRFDVILRGRNATPFENRPEGT
ncbi:MAG: protocatechuate 3,4-dioxygenase subunit beta [Pseudomonadota bacterium]